MIHAHNLRPFAILLLASYAGFGSPARSQAGQVAPGAGAAPTGAAPTGTPRAGAAPQAATAQRPAASRAARPYTLAVKVEDGFINVAVTAVDARLADIAADLATRLRTRVVVGPGLARQRVSVDVVSSPLETTLPWLAPRVLIDYEIRQDARPLPLVIYLLDATEADPPANIVQRGMSQGLLITGHTEDPTDGSAEDALQVSGNQHAMSITAKKQPLGLVAMAIAEVLGLTVDLSDDPAELIEARIEGLPAEDAVTSVSPNLRLHVRVDVTRAERTPIKLVVARPRAR